MFASPHHRTLASADRKWTSPKVEGTTPYRERGKVRGGRGATEARKNWIGGVGGTPHQNLFVDAMTEGGQRKNRGPRERPG